MSEIMKKIFSLFVLLFAFQYVTSQMSHSKELEPYLSFLKQNHKPAKEYILSLFKDNDIVVLCERHHCDITQYDLFLEIIRDSFFVKNVGLIFTEVGSEKLNPDLNIFLRNSKISKEEKEKKILDFQRRCMFPYWSKYNFSFFIEGLHDINKTLPENSKIELYPNDQFYISGDTTEENVSEMITRIAVRDSLIADNIINQYEKIRKSRPDKKALVIMNYRHAYNNKFNYTLPAGEKIKNTTEFLFNKYSGRIANVLINTTNIDNNIGVLQDGKWDAAFKLSGIENLGFHFDHSPFGNDNFDHWAYPNEYAYKDIFSGFVFYLPVEKFKLVRGVPGMMEDGFLEKSVINEKLYKAAFEKISKKKIELSTEKEHLYFNEMHIGQIEKLDTIQQHIEKWLK